MNHKNHTIALAVEAPVVNCPKCDNVVVVFQAMEINETVHFLPFVPTINNKFFCPVCGKKIKYAS